MAKIICTIEIGRRAYGCQRFGVCSITLGAELALRQNQDMGVLEWEPGSAVARLHWRGSETLDEQGICAVILDRAVYLPLPCTGNVDWFARQGRYNVIRDGVGEYIELQLAPVYGK